MVIWFLREGYLGISSENFFVTIMTYTQCAMGDPEIAVIQAFLLQQMILNISAP
jgi:hypothetical protein